MWSSNGVLSDRRHGQKDEHFRRAEADYSIRQSEVLSTCWDEVYEAADLLKVSELSLFVNGHNYFSAAESDGSIVSSLRKKDALVDQSSNFQLSSASSETTCVTACWTNDQLDESSGHASVQEHATGERSNDAGVLYPSRLKILAAKDLLNSGKEHLTTSGKLRKARHIKSPCLLNCRRCSTPKLSQEERYVVFDHFWSLKNHELQWKFIANAVEVFRPKRKAAAVKAGSKGEKCWSRVYSLIIAGRKMRVCKTMFKNTLCICDSWIDSALSHFNGENVVPDLRGRGRKNRL